MVVGPMEQSFRFRTFGGVATLYSTMLYLFFLGITGWGCPRQNLLLFSSPCGSSSTVCANLLFMLPTAGQNTLKFVAWAWDGMGAMGHLCLWIMGMDGGMVHFYSIVFLISTRFLLSW